MSELRQDPTTGSFVIVAPGRSTRPHASSTSRPPAQAVAPFDARCPFCPGNEAQLPGILAETPASDPPGWSIRVVPNKFPALTPDPPQPVNQDAAHDVMAGYGYHEVIIESPRHDADLASMETSEISTVVASYHARFCELSAKPDIAAVVLFRNHGTRSGASLVHPHAQAIALPLLPPNLQSMSEWGARQGEKSNNCPTCVELKREVSAGVRIVADSTRFVALVPYAAECPFEIWLLPKRHQASFAEASSDELHDLALLLRRALRGLKTLHGDPPYSFAIESGAPAAAARYLHWRLRIVPDLIDWGGFERGAGMPINPSAPEADAARLRQTISEERTARQSDT